MISTCERSGLKEIEGRLSKDDSTCDENPDGSSKIIEVDDNSKEFARNFERNMTGGW